MVEGAALEMLCPERDPGFESLTLRHEKALRDGLIGHFAELSFCMQFTESPHFYVCPDIEPFIFNISMTLD